MSSGEAASGQRPWASWADGTPDNAHECSRNAGGDCGGSHDVVSGHARVAP